MCCPQARVSAFLDFGNVYNGADNFDAGELRASVGVALLWRSPMGPLSISYALPLRKNLVLAVVAIVCFVAIALLRIPLLWVMLVMTPISVILTARYGERFAARPQGTAAKDSGKDTVKKEGAQ